MASYVKTQERKEVISITGEDACLCVACAGERNNGERMQEMFAEELDSERKWYWLSFADEEGTGEFLGVAIVEAGGIIEATVRARMHGCNPGGGVRAVVLDPENLPDESLRYRLLSKEELKENGLIG